MKDLLVNEFKKFFKPLFTKMMIVFVLAFPLLMISCQLFTERGERAVFNGSVISGSEVRKQMDYIQDEISGNVNKDWLKSIKNQFDDSSNDLYDLTLKKAYEDGLNMFSTRDTILNDLELDENIRNIYQNNEIYMGPHESWDMFFEMLSMASMVYGISCIFLFAGLFNREEETGATELIKSSKYGRLQITLCKMLVACFITVVLGILVSMICNSLGTFIFELPSQKVSVMLRPFIQMQSYQEVKQQSLYLILLGGMICSTFSLFISAFTKKISSSVSIGMVFFIFPILMKITVADLLVYTFFPSIFLDISNRSLRFPWMQFLNQWNTSLMTLLKIWIPLLLVMITMTIYHQSKDVLYIRKLRDY